MNAIVIRAVADLTDSIAAAAPPSVSYLSSVYFALCATHMTSPSSWSLHQPSSIGRVIYRIFCARFAWNRERPTQDFYSHSHDAVIRVCDDADNVIETHEHAGDLKEW